jgi:hypothetical protein
LEERGRENLGGFSRDSSQNGTEEDPMRKVALIICGAICRSLGSAYGRSLDRVEYTTIQACLNAAAALPSPGICYVPTGASVTFTLGSNNVEMASGATLESGAGVYINTEVNGAVGFIFFQFATGVTGAAGRGQRIDTTTLKNSSSRTQFGAVIQDEGTNDTYADLTADGDGNTTIPIIVRKTQKAHLHNLKAVSLKGATISQIVGNGVTAAVICTTSCVPPDGFSPNQVVRIAHNSVSQFDGDSITVMTVGTTTFSFSSATNNTGTGGGVVIGGSNSITNPIQIQGATDTEMSNIETVGGPSDGFMFVTTNNTSLDCGSIDGVRCSNICVHDSPQNGLSLNALKTIGGPTGDTVSNENISGLRSQNNGTIGSSVGADDESGLVLLANLTNGDLASISNVTIRGVAASRQGGPGVRLKGNITKSKFSGNVNGNGIHTEQTFRDAIVSLNNINNSGPTNNLFDFKGDLGSGTNLAFSQSNSSGNMFKLAVQVGTSLSAGDLAIYPNSNSNFIITWRSITFGGVGAVTDCTAPCIENKSGVVPELINGAQVNAVIGPGSSFGVRTTPGGTNIFQDNGAGGAQVLSGSFRAPQGIVDQETACTNGELALSAGWGNRPNGTATAIAGTGQTCQWTITAGGARQGANPTITDTLTNALPSASTVCDMRMVGDIEAATLINQITRSATAPVFTFGGTPVGSSTYIVVGRYGP